MFALGVRATRASVGVTMLKVAIRGDLIEIRITTHSDNSEEKA